MFCPSFQIRHCHKKSKDILKDRVSELPDNILGHILSFSPTKDVMQTSVLSKRWRNVWTSVLTVDINDRSISNDNFDNLETQFMNFVDKVLFGLNKVSLRIFRLKLSERYIMSRVREWIYVVALLNDLEEFELEYSPNVDALFELPPCIFTLKKLVNLTLSATVVVSYPSLVFLPSLKTLALHSIPLLNIDSLNTLLIGCPLLEEFNLSSECVDPMSGSTLRVKSRMMKSFKLSESYYPIYPLSRVVIDANNLEELVLKVPLTLHIELSTKQSSLVEVKLDIHNNGYSRIEVYDGADISYLKFLELLKKISNTRYLFLSNYAMEAFEHGLSNNVPLFKNLINLEGYVYKTNWAILQCLFESSPNLVSLSFIEDTSRCDHWRTLCSPPNLSMQQLENIKLGAFEGTEDDIELVTYFLKIAPVLKIITIVYTFMMGVSDFQTKILELRKAYPACKIEIKVWEGDLVI